MKRIFALVLLALVGQIALASQGAIQLPTSGTYSGATMVGYVNTAHAAMSTLQSGSSDPGTVGGPYSFWADTGNTLLKQRNGANTAWTTIAPLGGQLLPLSGGTVSGQVTMTYSSDAPVLLSTSGSGRYLGFATSGSRRWNAGASSASESGSNAGSDWFIARYSDAGSFIDSPFTIARSTGIATFTQTPIGVTPSTADNSTKIATTQYVQNQGYATTSYVTSQNYASKASATAIWNYYRSTNQTSGSTVLFDTARFTEAPSAHYSSGTGQFTAPATGYYQVSAGIAMANGTGASQTTSFNIVAGGATACGTTSVALASVTTGLTINCVAYVTSGQTIYVQFTGSGGSFSGVYYAAGVAGTYFSGYYIGN